MFCARPSKHVIPLTVKLLLVDDDVELCSLLKEFLMREGFTIAVEHDGKRGLEQATSGSADLVVLDVMLPTIDGFEVLRQLRRVSSVPVLMLTARSEDVDRIIGLELGADDYLAKPFNPRELAARIRAILRRMEKREPSEEGRIEVNGVILDPASREAFSNGKRVELTTFEFDILEILMRSAGRVLSRDALMENMYNRKATPFDRSIDMHVSHLRRKLEGDRPLIKTIRGIGYQFVTTADSEASA
jgi:two-component system, OmpR family, response regulator CpxR